MLAVVVLVAVGASHRLEAQPGFPRIIIGEGPDVGFTEFVVGVKEGVFARQGVTASLQLFPGGRIVPAFAAGDMDAFFAFEPHCTRALATVKGSHVLNRSGDDNVVLARAFGIVLKSLVEAGWWITSNPDKAAYISTEFNKSAADAKRTIGYIDIKQVNFDEPARDGLRKALESYVTFKGLPKARDIGPTSLPHSSMLSNSGCDDARLVISQVRLPVAGAE
jgi:ABC-type nitrate/sulfonate/bicarbonate transport system substrate-binding protein